jgi:hypothetical protein
MQPKKIAMYKKNPAYTNADRPPNKSCAIGDGFLARPMHHHLTICFLFPNSSLALMSGKRHVKLQFPFRLGVILPRDKGDGEAVLDGEDGVVAEICRVAVEDLGDDSLIAIGDDLVSSLARASCVGDT